MFRFIPRYQFKVFFSHLWHVSLSAVFSSIFLLPRLCAFPSFTQSILLCWFSQQSLPHLLFFSLSPKEDEQNIISIYHTSVRRLTSFRRHLWCPSSWAVMFIYGVRDDNVVMRGSLAWDTCLSRAVSQASAAKRRLTSGSGEEIVCT